MDIIIDVASVLAEAVDGTTPGGWISGMQSVALSGPPA